MTTWAAEEINQARRDLTLMGIDAEDMDDALAGSLALAIQLVTRKQRLVWAMALGFTAAGTCFAYATWAVITATAAW